MFHICVKTEIYPWVDRKCLNKSNCFLVPSFLGGAAKEQAEQLADAQLAPQGQRRAAGKLDGMQQGRT